jgi:Xaa-Pro aminopeptidase
MDAERGLEVLFVSEPSAMRESWEGEIWDSADAWVQELSGFSDVRESGSLADLLREWLEREPVVHVARAPWVALAGAVARAQPYERAQARDPFDGRPSREQALATALERDFGAQVKDLTPALDALRRVKQTEEIAAMRRAARSGALALAEGIRSTHAGLGEWELESLMSMVQVREGAAGPAYHAIVGSGRNSCVLHYSASARRMQAGEVVLVDYAPELDHYTADITRTWPVDGRFTPRMAELYDAVLAAQLAGIAVVKPGARVADVERACAQVLRERGFASLIRHGACHSIGMEVHDVPERGALVPGVAFTIEPGLYDTETGIGIRIEDVVVVTQDGCEVLSSGVPKERAALEALCAETGWLEQRAARPSKAP